jgi:hypothetical protein
MILPRNAVEGALLDRPGLTAIRRAEHVSAA